MDSIVFNQQTEEFQVSFSQDLNSFTVNFTPFGEPGLPGKSAYQIAVDNGFIGSESDWLLSLQGSRPISYKHVQNIFSFVWLISHNLGFEPNVSCFDTSGNECIGLITHINNNNISINFGNAAIKGEAFLS
jgi:hypothetical protein